VPKLINKDRPDVDGPHDWIPNTTLWNWDEPMVWYQ
jgi:hypothetical protein